MKFRMTLVAATVAAITGSSAWAAVSPDEAKQLGTTLTAIGAEKAGNKEGTIPAFTGGIGTPADYDKASGKRVDPFAGEKPRLTITGKDMAAHADKLTEGTKELLKRYPTMRLDVYPTHRTVALPARVAENTVKNATTAKLSDGGLGVESLVAGFPFPIPKNGYEAMWNHLLRYQGIGWDNAKYDSINIDANGTMILATTGEVNFAWPMYDPKKAGPVKETDPYWFVKVVYTAPARRVGEAVMALDYVNPLKQGRRAWQYLPGQRRVKLAPDIAYDTPNPGTAGGSTYDDVGVFNGAMDRYDFKLIGKKEMFVPYGNYRLTYAAKNEEIGKPNHVNPDLVRWELHRVWLVEATLKEGKRHIYAKRTFYLDEDSWAALASDEYDARGLLHRANFSMQSYSYDVQAPFGNTEVMYDLIAGNYNVTGLFGNHRGLKYMTEVPGERFWSAEALAGAGIR